jgi:hypothetical protein
VDGLPEFATAAAFVERILDTNGFRFVGQKSPGKNWFNKPFTTNEALIEYSLREAKEASVYIACATFKCVS